MLQIFYVNSCDLTYFFFTIRAGDKGLEKKLYSRRGLFDWLLFFDPQPLGFTRESKIFKVLYTGTNLSNFTYNTPKLSRIAL